MGLSSQAIHRHLKYMQNPMEDMGSIIKESLRTRHSYSGFKGAEATIYEINKKLYLSFGIFPNLMHVKIYDIDELPEIDKELHLAPQPQAIPSKLQKLLDRKIDPDLLDKTIIQPILETSTESEEASAIIAHLLKKIKAKVESLNNRLAFHEKAIAAILSEKNIIMELLNEIMEKEGLDFMERLLLRNYICTGEQCFTDISQIFDKDEEELQKQLEQLFIKKKWNLENNTQESLDNKNNEKANKHATKINKENKATL